MSDLKPQDELQNEPHEESPNEHQDEAQKAAEQLQASLTLLAQHSETLQALDGGSGIQISKDKAEALDALMAQLHSVGIQFRESQERQDHDLPDVYRDSWDDDEGA